MLWDNSVTKALCTHSGGTEKCRLIKISHTIAKSRLRRCLHCRLVVAISSDMSRETPRGARVGKSAVQNVQNFEKPYICI